MGNFERGRSGGGGNFRRGGFGGNRGSDRPVTMHQAVCSRCGKDCELPFRPTNSRPVFCSSCFDSNRNSDSGRFSTNGGPTSGWEGRNNGRSSDSGEREMFDAVCDECGNSCQVPFQPSSGKPIYCNDCFGEKKGAGNKEKGQSQYNEQFEQLNTKLDSILALLTPAAIVVPNVEEAVITEEISEGKKSSSKKKSPKAS